MTERWDETWHRLLEWTNGQARSERLAAQLLFDDGYQELDPSHPLGGQDGGKDAICSKNGQPWIMGVFFPRGQKTLGAIKEKFLDDVKGVNANNAVGIAFVTNQEIRLAERSELKQAAAPVMVDLFHLERITAILDKSGMAGIRKQFLNIETSANNTVYAEALPKTLNIVGQAEGMLRELAKAASRDIDPETIGMADLEQICKSINPNSPAPLLLNLTPRIYASWLQYLCYWRERSHQFTQEVLVFSSFLEPEHVALIARVEQCSYFSQLRAWVAIPGSNTDLSWLASSIWDYVQRARQLKQYAQRMKARLDEG